MAVQFFHLYKDANLPQQTMTMLLNDGFQKYDSLSVCSVCVSVYVYSVQALMCVCVSVSTSVKRRIIASEQSYQKQPDCLRPEGGGGTGQALRAHSNETLANTFTDAFSG